MELYTLASAAEIVGCTPSRLKNWMEKGYIPERRIQFGKVRARVIEEEALPILRRVLSGIEKRRTNGSSRFFKRLFQSGGRRIRN